MWRERGLTMASVTHDSTVARRAQRIGVMKKGLPSFRSPPGISWWSGFGLPIWRLRIPSPPTNDQWRHSWPRCRLWLSHPDNPPAGAPGMDNLFPLVNRN